MKNILFYSLFCCISQFVVAQEVNLPISFIHGDILIKVDDPNSLAELVYSLQIVNGAETKLAIVKEVSSPTNIWLLTFDFNAISHDDMMAALYTNKHILVAQNNHYVQERLTPNDVSFGTQWHHIDGSDNDIDSDLAWNVTTGGTTANGDVIVVCVIEGTGAQWAHADLVANHWVNLYEIDGNLIDDDGNGYVDDYDGWNSGNNTDIITTGDHGTGVSGMIGAVGNNTTNVAGINWNVKIMQVDMAGTLSEANVIAAYTYPLVMRQMYTSSGGTEGAFVVATNASWGIDNANPLSYPLWCGFYDDLGEAGILNCGATANNNVNIDVVGDMPTGCSSPYMISVTATNSSDVRTFSGYGQTTIDLGAPGANVVTTNNSGITTTSGTSFASPLTAGVIGLLYSVPCSNLADVAMSNPELAANIIRDALLDGTDPVANLTTETVTGGRLNANNSVQLIVSGCASYVCTAASSATPQDQTCFATCDGEITVAASGGSGSFTYDIGSGSQPSSIFTGLCAGTYSVTVNDGEFCDQQLINIDVDAPTEIGGTVAITDEFVGNDGAVNLTFIGGIGPYIFNWNGPGPYTASTEDISGLVGGVYDVSISDANGCIFSIVNINVQSPTICTATVNSTPADEICFGDCNGQITIVATGGSGTYTYDIGSGPQVSPTFTGLCVGPYAITVDDGALCTVIVNETIAGPTELTGGSVAIDQLCFGTCDGEIVALASGGTGPMMYDIGGALQILPIFSGLCVGPYTITVTDANGCIVVSNDVVGAAIAISGGTSVTSELTGNDGAIDLTVSGGTSTYTYSWTGPGGFTSSTEDVTGLVGGVYSVTITDANGCVLAVTNILVSSSVGIIENGISYSLFPNPANKEFTLQLPEGQNIILNLYDAIGNSVLTQSANKTTTVNISALAQGVYVYTLTDDLGKKATGKLVVE